MALPRASRSKKTQESRGDYEGLFPLQPLIHRVFTDCIDEFTNVHYLGPLRSPAKRYYITNLETTPTMDASGDFLPYVLRDQTERRVFFLPPRGSETTLQSLRIALNSWMFYLRTGIVAED